MDFKKISAFSLPEQSPGFLLWQVSTLWRRKIEAALLPLDLTHSQFVLLAGLGWLTKDKSNISQVQLAKHCRMDITMTSQILRALEKRALIRRIQIPGNEKSKFPKTTSKGANLIKKAIPLVEREDQKFFLSLGKNATRLLKSLLDIQK